MQQTAYSRIVRRRNIAGRTTEYKSLLDRIKDLCRSIVTFFFAQIGVCGLLVGYNVSGAFVFSTLEGIYGDASVEERANYLQQTTVKYLWNLTLNLNVLDEVLWRESTERAVMRYEISMVPLIRDKRYTGLYPVDTWTIPASLMYCLGVYTTIGYGNMVPRTEGGKIATIFYALVGMPLMLLYMSNVGEVLGGVFKFLYFRACRCDIGSLGYFRSGSGTIRPIKANQAEVPHKHSKSRERGKGSKHRQKARPVVEAPKENIPILWCLCIIASYVVFGGMIFTMWESWTFLDACYFCYTSLSTIGLGDIVPGGVRGYSEKGDTIGTQQILATVYLMIGMALVAMCFNLMQEGAIDNLKAFWRGIGLIRGDLKTKNAPPNKSSEEESSP